MQQRLDMARSLDETSTIESRNNPPLRPTVPIAEADQAVAGRFPALVCEALAGVLGLCLESRVSSRPLNSLTVLGACRWKKAARALFPQAWDRSLPDRLCRGVRSSVRPIEGWSQIQGVSIASGFLPAVSVSLALGQSCPGLAESLKIFPIARSSVLNSGGLQRLQRECRGRGLAALIAWGDQIRLRRSILFRELRRTAGALF